MNCKELLLLIFIFSILYSIPVLAETTGKINFTTANTSITTGLFGYTVEFCNSDSDCFGYKCFLDYDGTSSGSYSGWCNSTSVTNCYHNGTAILSGSNLCINTTAYRSCSSGNWSGVTNCASGYTCSNGNCSAPTTTTIPSGEATTTTIPVIQASIKISLPIANFNLTQGESIIKSLTVENDGDLTLYDITLSLTGIEWYKISPTKFDNISVGESKIFSVNFSIPSNATVKEYTITTELTTSNQSVSASSSFTLKVLPSIETVKKEILPLYQEYLLLIEDLEKNITELKNKGADTTELFNLLNTIKDKLNQTNSSLEKEDYFNAKQLLDSIKILIDDLKVKIAETEIPQAINIVFILIIIIIILVAIALAYLLWPTKYGYHPKYGWKPQEKESKVKNILERIKKIKRKKEKFKYAFGS